MAYLPGSGRREQSDMVATPHPPADTMASRECVRALVQVVASAEDENAAVAWLRDPNNRCDLVIVDIFLKSGSGLGVLQRLRDAPDAPRRVVLSNHATPEVRTKCVELGAEKVFDKSNEIDEMLAWFNRPLRSDRAAPASRS